MDITQELEERARSYEASGPSAQHTAALLRKAQAEIMRLNSWADGFSDAQMKERRLSEELIREVIRENERLKADLATFGKDTEATENRIIDAEFAAQSLRTALMSIAGFGSVNLQGEYEHGLRDTIRSMIDCAKNALESTPLKVEEQT